MPVCIIGDYWRNWGDFVYRYDPSLATGACAHVRRQFKVSAEWKVLKGRWRVLQVNACDGCLHRVAYDVLGQLSYRLHPPAVNYRRDGISGVKTCWAACLRAYHSGENQARNMTDAVRGAIHCHHITLEEAGRSADADNECDDKLLFKQLSCPGYYRPQFFGLLD